ncbi:hypothetical protein Patl1_36507 [Pistacia atlantica]|nr:hypothetical protein Patl1_36507 [Pistacia atlantica]
MPMNDPTGILLTFLFLEHVSNIAYNLTNCDCTSVKDQPLVMEVIRKA